MTQSTKFQAFIRPKDGYKVTIKFPCVFALFFLETNSKSSKIYLIATMKIVATVSWHKSLQFVQKSNITLLSGLFMILLAISIIILRLGITF